MARYSGLLRVAFRSGAVQLASVNVTGILRDKRGLYPLAEKLVRYAQKCERGESCFDLDEVMDMMWEYGNVEISQAGPEEAIVYRVEEICEDEDGEQYTETVSVWIEGMLPREEWELHQWEKA